MKKIITVLTLCAMLLALRLSAIAQQQGKVRRIGFLASASPAVVTHRFDAFQQGLRDLGYVEGKNIIIESRYAEGKLDRLAAELMLLKIEILVSGGPIPTRAAKEAAVTIPIVMTRILILLATALSPAWRDRAATLRDCRRLLRSSAENAWSF